MPRSSTRRPIARSVGRPPAVSRSATREKAPSLAHVSRRSLLGFALGSPLLLAAKPVDALEWLFGELAKAEETAPARSLIGTASEALHVFDFEPLARRNLSPAHWAYLSQGVHDEFTLKANREAFGDVQLVPRRLVDTTDLDTKTSVLGTELPFPIALSPCGSQKAFHPDAELAVARAARSRDWLQILSTASSTELEDVVAAREAPIWFQLYTAKWMTGTKMQLEEAEEAGCPAVVVTVDTSLGTQSNRDRVRAFRRADNPECQSCHATSARMERGLRTASRVGEFFGVDVEDAIGDWMALDWDYLDKIRDNTSMKVLVKGIQAPEDAALCIEHGVDGIVVSNHGGRAEDSGYSTIEALPGIADAVDGRIPILVDSGFRRGPDIFKGLALGASAVCVGRPYLWGLAAFGQEGVEAVMTILEAELETIMRSMGTPDVASITRDYVKLKPPRATG